MRTYRRLLCWSLGPALLAIAAADAAPVRTATRTFRSSAALPGSGELEAFGRSIATDGQWLLVGATDVSLRTFAGAAYLFDVTTGERLRTINGIGGRNAYFGAATALHSGTAIIGAPRRPLALAGTPPQPGGKVHLFDASTGADVGALAPSDSYGGDGFGFSLAASGNVLLVGAPGEPAFGTTAGGVYVFDLTTRAQLRKLTPHDGAAGDNFGYSVAVADNLALVGAINRDGNRGAAYLFDITTGEQIRKFEPVDPDSAPGGGLGTSVALQGSLAIIGAKWDLDPATAPAQFGSVFVFDVNTGEQLANLVVEEPFPGTVHRDVGFSVAASAERIVVGAPLPDSTFPRRGGAFVYDASSFATDAVLGWTPSGFNNSIPWHGASAAIHGVYAFIGAPGDAAVYMYSIVPEPGGMVLAMTVAALISRRRCRVSAL